MLYLSICRFFLKIHFKKLFLEYHQKVNQCQTVATLEIRPDILESRKSENFGLTLDSLHVAVKRFKLSPDQ